MGSLVVNLAAVINLQRAKRSSGVFSARNPADKAPVAQSCMYQHWRLDMATTAARVADDNSIHRVLRDNGLSLVLFGLFAVSLVGQALTGHRHYNDEQIEHGQPTVSITEYLRSGEFLEATAENWESEFLQMGAYVLFTCFLFQRGSSESKKIGQPEAVDRDPRLSKNKRGMPWPVRRGGWVLT